MKEDLPTLRFESLLSYVLLVLFQASGATELIQEGCHDIECESCALLISTSIYFTAVELYRFGLS